MAAGDRLLHEEGRDRLLGRPGSPKCLAVQSADTVPVLIAMGARALLVSREGEREIAIEDLYRNDGIDYVTKRPDELLTAVLLPRPNGWQASYRKLRRRGPSTSRCCRSEPRSGVR